MIRNRPAANSQLTLVKQGAEGNGDAGDKYNGLDRFGRIVDQRWITGTGCGATATDRFQYGYNEDSNPLYKKIMRILMHIGVAIGFGGHFAHRVVRN